MALYEDIPSHIAQTDSVYYFNIDRATFEKQIMAMGSSIPMDYQAAVISQIQYLMRQPSSFYETLHQRMQLYFPIYEKVLDRYNLPQELKYVSIIESNLNPNAQSWCGAMGLWQFMPYTGRSMGMRIDYSIDERKSIINSTEKACEFFTSSFTTFNDWLLAIASYNCGPGNVNKAIRKSGSTDFWKVRYYLPKETQAYVPRFIATAYVLNYTRFATYNSNTSSHILVPTPIDSAISITHLAGFLKVDPDLIYSYNRELLKKTTIENHTTSIMLPYDLSMLFLENRDSAYAYAREQKAIEAANTPVYEKTVVKHVHVVKKGQTLYSIAKMHGVTTTQLKAWNHRKSNAVAVGQHFVYYKTQWTKTNP